MKAIRLCPPGNLDALRMEEMADPGDPGPGEIRVRLHASSLNFHDLLVVSGRMATATPLGEGRIPMSDGAGVTEFAMSDAVISLIFPQWQDGGAAVASFSGTPGDGIDGYARDAVVAPATWFTRAPRGYSHAEAATVVVAGLTAWRALVIEGGLKPGDVVLTLGTGGVSIFALQLAKAMGARVIVTSSSDAKLERARALGADDTINYRTTEQWSAAVLDLTGGRGADHVVEIGGPGTLSQSMEACRIGGRIAMIGILTGAKGEVRTGLLIGRQQRLQALLAGSRKHQQDLVRALDGLSLRPVIDRTFPLALTADAFRYEMSGQHFGKICLEI